LLSDIFLHAAVEDANLLQRRRSTTTPVHEPPPRCVIAIVRHIRQRCTTLDVKARNGPARSLQSVEKQSVATAISIFINLSSQRSVRWISLRHRRLIMRMTMATSKLYQRRRLDTALPCNLNNTFLTGHPDLYRVPMRLRQRLTYPGRTPQTDGRRSRHGRAHRRQLLGRL